MPVPVGTDDTHSDHYILDMTQDMAGPAVAAKGRSPTSTGSSSPAVERAATANRSSSSLRHRKSSTAIGSAQQLVDSLPSKVAGAAAVRVGSSGDAMAATELREPDEGVEEALAGSITVAAGSGEIDGLLTARRRGHGENEHGDTDSVSRPKITQPPSNEMRQFSQCSSKCEHTKYVEEPGTFDVGIFVYQLVIHLGYPLALPLMNAYYGSAAIGNQFMFPLNLFFKTLCNTKKHGSLWVGCRQLVFFMAVLMVMVLKFLDLDWLQLLTTSEVMLLITVHVIRIVMIAVKYGFMDAADYEVIQRSVGNQEQVHQLMFHEMLLGGWELPDRHKVQHEIQRAADERGFSNDGLVDFEQRSFYFHAEDAPRLQQIICEGSEDPHVVTRVAADSDSGDGQEFLSVSVKDICTNIWRKASLESKQWDRHMMRGIELVAYGVAAMPHFWRAQQFGWRNICGRSSEPMEVVIILIAFFLNHNYTRTNLWFMKVVLNDFNRRKRALQLCGPPGLSVQRTQLQQQHSMSS